MKVINPATEEIIRELPEDDRSSVENKISNARRARVAWSKTPVEGRIQVLSKFKDLLIQNQKELAAVLTSEMGKPLQQSLSEIEGACGRITFFLDNSKKWLEEEVVSEQEVVEKISYEPLGVIANISAWNYPYLVGVNVFVPALIGGNGVIYKPSEWATLTGIRIGEMLLGAGVTPDVFQVAIGGGEVGQILLESEIDGYFFTGSYATGNHIYQTVAPRMVPCQLELGGKDPLYISADNSNIPQVAALAAEGAFYNNGQSCCAVERIYVHQDIYDDFLESFLGEVEQYRVGDPREADTFIGPLARPSQLAFLAGQVKDGIDKGAKILIGGSRIERPGYFFEPTILVDVDHSMDIMTQESFGPVIGVQKVADDDEALRLMQDTEYGLTGAVFSDSLDAAQGILENLKTGTVYWNCSDRVSANLPWSGRKKSGIGSTLSYQGIRAFVQPKAYHLRRLN